MTQRSSGLSEERRRERVAMIREEMARDFVEGEERYTRKKKTMEKKKQGFRSIQAYHHFPSLLIFHYVSPFSPTRLSFHFCLCFTFVSSLSLSRSNPAALQRALLPSSAPPLNTRGIEEGWTERERESESCSSTSSAFSAPIGAQQAHPLKRYATSLSTR